MCRSPRRQPKYQATAGALIADPLAHASLARLIAACAAPSLQRLSTGDATRGPSTLAVLGGHVSCRGGVMAPPGSLKLALSVPCPAHEAVRHDARNASRHIHIHTLEASTGMVSLPAGVRTNRWRRNRTHRSSTRSKSARGGKLAAAPKRLYLQRRIRAANRGHPTARLALAREPFSPRPAGASRRRRAPPACSPSSMNDERWTSSTVCSTGRSHANRMSVPHFWMTRAQATRGCAGKSSRCSRTRGKPPGS